MARPRWVIAVPVLLLALSAASAQDADEVDPLFASEEVLNVRIVAPFDIIARDRPVDEYVSGKFHYTAGDGELVELDVGVRTRGRYRRRPDICSFPPLRLNFKKSQVKETLFTGQDKLKLVTQCATGSYIYEQALLAEFLAYRILNLLTDTSFRVRLLRIEYVNTGVEKSFDGYAVLIEHKDSLARRIGIPPLVVEKTTVASLEPKYLNLTSVFQYLIGNTDFSPIAGSRGGECCHNHTLFGEEGESYYSIPYDFDMSGFISAPHATPNPKLRLDSVRERLYRGRCVNNELLPATLDKFQAKRDDIEGLIRDQAGLGRTKREEILRFVSDFYRKIASTKSVNRHFVSKCE